MFMGNLSVMNVSIVKIVSKIILSEQLEEMYSDLVEEKTREFFYLDLN